MRAPALLLLMALAGCDAMPRDPERSTERIREERRIRLGLGLDANVAATRALVARLTRETAATPVRSDDAMEAMLAKLERGDLDLVIAWFDEDSPWLGRVALAPPIATRGTPGHRQELRAAMRGGENWWIMRVEIASRAVAGAPGA